MLARAEELSSRVHVDVCDGRFADTTTVGLARLHPVEGGELDLHLMLQEPLAQLETALSLKPSLIIFHAESSGDIAGAMAHLRELGIKAGTALLPTTPVEAYKDLVEHSDHVLIFTGTLGHNGGVFQPEQLAKVAQIRAIKPDIEISVDGGVNDQNAALITGAGVDTLYVGNFLQAAADPAAAYASMQSQVGVAV